MAWIIKTDGVNDFLSIARVTLSGDFKITFTDFRFVTDPTSGFGVVIGTTTSASSFFITREDENKWQFRFSGSNTDFSFTDVPPTTDRGTLIIERVGTSATLTFNGISKTNPCSGNDFVFDGFSKVNSVLYKSIEYGTIEVIDSSSTVIHRWDATASVNGASPPIGTPILIDTIGGNNSTGVNMPTDGSAWIDLGGGGITVTVQDLTQSQTIDSVTLTQSHVLTLNELNQVQTIDNIVLGELSNVSINELSQAQALDNITLLENQSITVNEVNQNQSLDNIDLTQGYTLSVNELSQTQELGNVTITTGDQIAVNELSQNQTLEQITLVQAGVLVLDEINQAQLISNLNLQSMTPITVQNLSQSQLLENVDVTLLAELVQINDATQSQTIDEITLLQNSIIQIDSLSQSQLLQSINYGGVVVGYLEGELNIFYSLNGDILVYNAMNGSTKILG